MDGHAGQTQTKKERPSTQPVAATSGRILGVVGGGLVTGCKKKEGVRGGSRRETEQQHTERGKHRGRRDDDNAAAATTMTSKEGWGWGCRKRMPAHMRDSPRTQERIQIICTHK